MKLVAVLSDMSSLVLYNISEDLYNRIRIALGNPQFVDFQKLYDGVCTINKPYNESEAILLNELFEELISSPEIKTDFIQVY